MSEPTLASVGETAPVAESITQGQGQENLTQPTDGSGGGNPKWQPFLDVLPTSLHGVVTPVLQEWDRGVNQRFQELHQQYEPYKAYQQFVDNGIDPQAIDYALGIFQQLNDNPRGIYDALGTYYAEEWGLNQQQDQQYMDPMSEPNENVDPRIAELQDGFKQLASIILSERQQQEEQQSLQQADQELDDLLTQLKTQHGDFNERVVLGLMLAGLEPDEAIAEYQSTLTNAVEATRRPPAPGIISQGGVTAPAQQQDIRKMSGKDTRALVAQMLQQAQSNT